MNTRTTKIRTLRIAISAVLCATLLPLVQGQSTGTSATNQTAKSESKSNQEPMTPTAASQPASTGAESTNNQSNVVQLATFEVTGERASLMSAQEIKQQSGQIVDSIVASDINKLPDVNVSYSLSRIPGIQVAHTFAGLGGNGAVTIHGLTQVENTIDGREVFTTGGASGGGIANGQRTFDYSSIPSALIAGIDVYKTSAANQIEGGLGGLINVRLRKPFDFGDGLHIAGAIGTTHSDLFNGTKPNYNFVISDSQKTGIGKIGVLASFSFNDAPWREDNIGMGNPTTSNTQPNPIVIATGFPDALFSNGYNAATSWGVFQTIGFNTEVQWQPTEHLQLYAGVNHNQWKNIEDQVSMLIGLPASSAVPGSGNVFSGSQTAVKNATFQNVTGTSYSVVRDLSDYATMAFAGGKWTLGNLNLDFDLSHYTSSYSFKNNGVWMSVSIPSLTYDLGSTVPSAYVTGASLYDPSIYQARQVINRLFPSSGKEDAGRLDATYFLNKSIFTKIRAGLRYAQTKQGDENLGLYLGGYNIPADQQNLSNFGDKFRPSPIQNFFSGYSEPEIQQYLSSTKFSLFRDPAAMLKAFGAPDSVTPQNDVLYSSLLNIFNIKETTTAFYVMPEFSGTIGGLPFDGNIGLRGVRTKDDLRGNQVVTPAAVSPTGKDIIGPIHLNSSYTDWLPSFNGRLKFTDKIYLRAAVSKTITRPNFGSISPSLTLNRNPINPDANSGSQGNPHLKPIRSTNYDLSLEDYLSKDTVVYIAGFYKKVSGFIANKTDAQTYDGVTYQITTPENLNPATIKGFEVGYHQFFTFLPAPFDGLGIQANYTYVLSSTPSTIQGYDIPLTNLSKKSYNIIAMYEKGRFSARIAYNWRSKYVTGVSNFVNVGLLQQVVRAYGDLDASVNFDVTKNIQISIQGVNLLNTLRYQYWGSAQFPSNAYIDGTTLLASTTFRF